MARRQMKNAAKNGAASRKNSAKKGAASNKDAAKKGAAPRKGSDKKRAVPEKGAAKKEPESVFDLAEFGNLGSKKQWETLEQSLPGPVTRTDMEVLIRFRDDYYGANDEATRRRALTNFARYYVLRTDPGLLASKDELNSPHSRKKIADFIDIVKHYSKYGRLPVESKYTDDRERFLAKQITALPREADDKHKKDCAHLDMLIEVLMWTAILEYRKDAINNAAAAGEPLLPRFLAHDLLYVLDGLLWAGSPDNHVCEKHAPEVIKLYLTLLDWGTNGEEFTSHTDAAPLLEGAQGVNEGTMEPHPLENFYRFPGASEATMDLNIDAQDVTEVTMELDTSNPFALPGLEEDTGTSGVIEAAMDLGTFDALSPVKLEECIDAPGLAEGAMDLDTRFNTLGLADPEEDYNNDWADYLEL